MTKHEYNEYGLEQIRKRYGVPAKMGGQVTYTGKPGRRLTLTIVGSDGQYIFMKDGTGYVTNYHPTWALEYADEKCSA